MSAAAQITAQERSEIAAENPAGPVPMRLLPDSAEIGHDGMLSIGGVGLDELAERFGTPAFIYDEDHLRARCDEAVRAFGPGVAYATKAFLCRAMARLAADSGMHLDVASLGELQVALHAGVDPKRLVMHGNNKSMAELEAAVEVGIARIVVDSFDELDRLEVLAERTGERPKVLLRVTPGVEAHTHEFIATGQDDSKFGLTVSTGVAAAAVDRVLASDSVELVGIHAHVGSQVFSSESLYESARVTAEFAKPYGLPELSVGGGLGVPYVCGEWAPSITAWADEIKQAFESVGLEATVMAEPGRAIVASAAVTVYRVGTIKHLEGIRTYVSVDGGMSDNPRPVLYGSGYEMFLARCAGADRPMQARLVGKHCESGDLLIREGYVPADVAVDDLLVTPVTGAYGYSLASNYNKLMRPPVVFVADGKARLVRRREQIEDLLALDVD